MRPMPPGQSSLARLVMSTALRPRPASVSRKPGNSWQPASPRGRRRPARTGHGPDGLQFIQWVDSILASAAMSKKDKEKTA